MYKKTKEVTFCPQWMPMKQSTNTGHLLLRPLVVVQIGLPSRSKIQYALTRPLRHFQGSLSLNKIKVAGYSVYLIYQFHIVFPTFEKKIEDHAHERYCSCVQSVYGVYVHVYTDRDL